MEPLVDTPYTYEDESDTSPEKTLGPTGVISEKTSIFHTDTVP